MRGNCSLCLPDNGRRAHRGVDGALYDQLRSLGQRLRPRAERHRPLQASTLVVLPARLEPHRPRTASRAAYGLLLLAVTPGGPHRPGSRRRAAGVQRKKLTATADVKTSRQGSRTLKLSRAGETLAEHPRRKLGVAVDKRPLAEALAAWRSRRATCWPWAGATTGSPCPAPVWRPAPCCPGAKDHYLARLQRQPAEAGCVGRRGQTQGLSSVASGNARAGQPRPA